MGVLGNMHFILLSRFLMMYEKWRLTVSLTNISELITEFLLHTDNLSEMESNDEEDKFEHDCAEYFCSDQSY